MESWLFYFLDRMHPTNTFLKPSRNRSQRTAKQLKETGMRRDSLTSDDFGRCVAFHGHVCPGLAIGYQVAKAGMAWLDENRATDEEVVAIVETDACGTDAIQVLTGCTLGKGNLLYKDYGKQVFTFISRKSGKGVRIAMKPEVIKLSERHRELIGKMRDERATEAQQKEFWAIHHQQAREILEKPADELFTIRNVEIALPQKAKIEPSILCDQCGEPTMASRLVDRNGQKVCMDCLGKPRHRMK
jgi:formylmethanofuran dehydrogenase subunit E